MKKDTEFHSALAPRMREFVDFKRMQGYDYTDQARTLGYFDRFLVEEPGWSHDSALALETLRRYVDTTEGLKPFTRSTRISSVREFSRHLHARNQHSAVLPGDILPRVRRTERFFLITPGQVADLMGAAATVLPGDGIRARTVSLLIGVLYSTGLRISEALDLTLGDIDRERSTLHVARGKFAKERLAPMSASTLAAVTAYLSVREPHAGNCPGSPLFIASHDTALTRAQAYRHFQRMCQRCGILGDPLPRLHDLRHNYACRRLALWREAGLDIEALLPVLATAMGHVNILATQRYLHIDAIGLLDASEKFNTYSTNPREQSK